MSWDVLICCSDRQKYCSACFQLHFTHISLFFLTTSTPFFMKRRDSVCFIFPPSLVFFFGFFFIPLCGGDNKQSPMCQFGTHPRLVDVCSISKTLAVSGFGPINNRIRKKKPGPDSATTLYLFIQ